jgi:hypothetical protein
MLNHVDVAVVSICFDEQDVIWLDKIFLLAVLDVNLLSFHNSDVLICCAKVRSSCENAADLGLFR